MMTKSEFWNWIGDNLGCDTNDCPAYKKVCADSKFTCGESLQHLYETEVTDDADNV